MFILIKRSRQFDPRIAIIGGGFGGITAAVRLSQQGFDNFVVFDRLHGPGGTWRANDYPGSEVDVNSTIYRLPFMDYTWTRTHARQPELLEYIEKVMDRYDLRGHFRFSTIVEELRWDDVTKTYTVVLQDGSSEIYNVVVTAVGLLSDPKELTWPGLDEFEGHVFHSSMWRHDVDLSGKTVAVVGVGSTAAQIIPAIAPTVKQLYVYQREPGWVLPKGDRTYSEIELDKRKSSLYRKREWLRLMAKREWSFVHAPIYLTNSKRNVAGEAAAHRYLDKVFDDRPELKAALTPQYVFSGKRRVLSDDYYPSLLRTNVQLVPRSVAALTRTGIVDSDGVEREVDVVVAAVGFKASTFLSSLRVYGREGVDLHDVWKDGAYAFLGVTVPNFPNLYMMYGPNTNGGAPITVLHDQQAHYIVKNVQRMARSGVRAIDVKPRWVAAYNRWLQTRMRGTAWLEGNNYFKGPKGTIVTQWRDGLLLYATLIRLLRRTGSRNT